MTGICTHVRRHVTDGLQVIAAEEKTFSSLIKMRISPQKRNPCLWTRNFKVRPADFAPTFLGLQKLSELLFVVSLRSDTTDDTGSWTLNISVALLRKD